MSERKQAISRLKTGRMLLAQPFMHAPPFTRSAVLLTDYMREEGAVGFILNKPLKMKVDRLIANFPEFDGIAFYGGPVQTDIIHYVHTYGDLLSESTAIGQGMYWGGQFEKLKALIAKGLIIPGRIRFYVGYSGWSPGQLEAELEEGSWVIGDADKNIVFNTSTSKLWKRAMSHQGDVYSVIAQIPQDFGASMN